MKPAVSVIVATYNQADFLKQCLQSILDQTRTDWEIIVVNNFSTDHTVEVVHSFNDSRIRCVNFHNQGVIGAAKNEGVKYARADLIAFLDSDDWWAPQKLEKVLTIFEKDQVDLVCHDVKVVYDQDRIQIKRVGPHKSYAALLFGINSWCVSAVTLKKKRFLAVGGFSEDPNMVGTSDYDLWMRLVKQGCRVYFLHQVLGSISKHGQNMSGDIETQCQRQLDLLAKHFKNWPNKNLYYQYLERRKRAQIFQAIASSWRRRKEYTKAKKYLYQSLKCNPFFWRSWILLKLVLLKW